jgi:hypothetical protein
VRLSHSLALSRAGSSTGDRPTRDGGRRASPGLRSPCCCCCCCFGKTKTKEVLDHWVS